MAENYVMEQLKKFEETFHYVIKYDSIKIENTERNYEFISSMIDFIRNTDHIQGDNLKSVIFLIGATGGGKTTLLNYLHAPNNLVVANLEGKLEVRDKNISVGEIGNGKGSTTLFPNIWISSFGNFMDCPGEGDTRGMIAEIVDSIFKLKVSSNVERVKIVFVVPEASLGSEGGYGMPFKNALDKNAQFLWDIKHFKNSMAFVISHAGLKQTALENCVQLINAILNEHASPSAYKDAVSHVMSVKNIQTFSRPSDDLNTGDPYFPPSWNPYQREKIIEMIEKLPYTSIPREGFFNISTSSDVREAMSKAHKIVEMKASLLLKDLVEKASPFTVFAVELKPFVKYIGSLINGCNTDLLNFVKILEWNNYLKIKPDKQLINKLHEEMLFLSQFTKGQNVEKNHAVAKDWAKTADLIDILTKIHNNTYSIINRPANNFLKWVTQGNVTVRPSFSSAYDIMINLKSLDENYRKQKEIELLGRDQKSLYFDAKSIKIFSHNEDVPYKEKIMYETTECYEEQTQHYVLEKTAVKETKFRPVTKTREERYEALTPVTQYRDDYYTAEEPNNTRTAFFGVLTLGLSVLARGGKYTDTVTKTKEVPYTEYRPLEKTRQVTYDGIESYEEDVVKHIPVEKTKTVSKCRAVIQEKEVEKIKQKPVYKDEKIKKLNSQKHAEDANRCASEISKYRKLILDGINLYPKAEKLGDHKKDLIISLNEFDKKYKDLLTLWQEAEYEAYFADNPKNSLLEIDIQTIGNPDEDIRL